MAQNNAVSPIDPSDAGIAAEAATKGDLAALSPEQRTALYGATCSSMGLNPLSQPFQYIKLNGKLTLYATRTATDQLRTLNGVSITKVEKEVFDDVLTVTVHATDATGRSDMEIGAVMIGGLRGEALANAHMKALTKAKRRVTLSICGLGWLDESEVPSVPTASAVVVDQSTGEITGPSELAAPDPKKAMRRLHAVAKNAGITHPMLHEWAVQACKVESLAAVEYRFIDGLASKLEDVATAESFISKYAPVETPADAVDPADAQSEYIDVNDPAFGTGVTTPGMFA